MAASSSAAADLLLPPGDEGYDNFEEEEEEYDPEEAAAVDAKMADAIALNQQLKAMMAMAEEQEARAAAQRQQPRQKFGGPSGSRAGVPAQRPRPLGVAKNGGWGGLTHTAGRAQEINRDNAILVSKLSSIHIERKRPNAAHAQQPFRQNPQRTAAAINRRKQDDKIARENAALAKRLNSVKPTQSLSNKAAAQHAQKHTQLLRVLQPGRTTTLASMAPPRSRARSAGGPRPPQSMLPVLRGQMEPRPFEF